MVFLTIASIIVLSVLIVVFGTLLAGGASLFLLFGDFIVAMIVIAIITKLLKIIFRKKKY